MCNVTQASTEHGRATCLNHTPYLFLTKYSPLNVKVWFSYIQLVFNWWKINAIRIIFIDSDLKRFSRLSGLRSRFTAVEPSVVHCCNSCEPTLCILSTVYISGLPHDLAPTLAHVNIKPPPRTFQSRARMSWLRAERSTLACGAWKCFLSD